MLTDLNCNLFFPQGFQKLKCSKLNVMCPHIITHLFYFELSLKKKPTGIIHVLEFDTLFNLFFYNGHKENK